MTEDERDLTIDDEIAIAGVELEIIELITELDSWVEEWVDEVDRALVINYMCQAYVQGYLAATRKFRNLA